MAHPAVWNEEQVEAYLARFSVAEAVQLAVNSAIAHKAADPIMHIADFLEAKGLEIELAQAAESMRGGRVADELPPLPLPRDRTQAQAQAQPALTRRATASDSELAEWSVAAPPP